MFNFIIAGSLFVCGIFLGESGHGILGMFAVGVSIIALLNLSRIEHTTTKF